MMASLIHFETLTLDLQEIFRPSFLIVIEEHNQGMDYPCTRRLHESQKALTVQILT